MRDLVAKLSSSGSLVTEFFAGTRSNTKARMLLDQYSRLVGCSVDTEMLSAANLSLLLTPASQMLNRKPDVSGKGESAAAAKFLTDEMGAFLAG